MPHKLVNPRRTVVSKCCVCLGFSVESKNGLTLIVLTQDISTALIGKLCHLSRKVKMNQLRSRETRNLKSSGNPPVMLNMEMSDKSYPGFNNSWKHLHTTQDAVFFTRICISDVLRLEFFYGPKVSGKLRNYCTWLGHVYTLPHLTKCV